MNTNIPVSLAVSPINFLHTLHLFSVPVFKIATLYQVQSAKARHYVFNQTKSQFNVSNSPDLHVFGPEETHANTGNNNLLNDWILFHLFRVYSNEVTEPNCSSV